MKKAKKKESLRDLRTKVDLIDKEISDLLERRLNIISQIGDLKAKSGKVIRDKKREEIILSKLKTDYEKEIFKKIIHESRKAEKKRTNL